MKIEKVLVKRIIVAQDNFSIFIGEIHNQEETFVGAISVVKGQKLNVEGDFVVHAKFGKQFKIKTFEFITKLENDDIAEYLQTFRGIGPAKASKIIAAYGESTITEISRNYMILTQFGISPEIAYEVYYQITKNQIVTELLKLLKPYGISLTMTNKIYDTFGEESLNVVQKNPYRLRDISKGITFDVVDKMALKNGIRPNGGIRIKGAIKYILEVISERGHSLYYASQVAKGAVELLNKSIIDETKKVTKADVIKVLVHMDENKNIIVDSDTAIYLPFFYFAERNVAKKLLKLNNKKYSVKLNRPFEELISEVEDEIGIKYSNNQRDAIYNSLLNPISVITGGPGTGKTTTVNGLLRVIEKNNQSLKIALTAPTGKAAKRMEESTKRSAKTIHRALEYKPMNGQLECGRNENNPLDEDVFVIDESSMIDILLMDKFLKAVIEGKQIVIVGDVDQLASVGPGNVLKDIIESHIIPIVKLDTIFRQKGTSTIVINANKINNGNKIILTNDDFTLTEVNDSDDAVAKKIVDDYMNLIESGLTVEKVQVLSPFKRKTECGATHLNNLIQERYNPFKPGTNQISYGFVIFREGDKVMQTKNNAEKECYNGDVGFIKQVIKGSDTRILVDFDGRIVDFNGREEILQLELAYACSVHKSQGSEYETILMPMVDSHKKMLTRNLFYTGVTRAKKNVKLYGTQSAIAHAISNKSKEVRFSKLAEKLMSNAIDFVS